MRFEQVLHRLRIGPIVANRALAERIDGNDGRDEQHPDQNRSRRTIGEPARPEVCRVVGREQGWLVQQSFAESERPAAGGDRRRVKNFAGLVTVLPRFSSRKRAERHVARRREPKISWRQCGHWEPKWRQVKRRIKRDFLRRSPAPGLARGVGLAVVLVLFLAAAAAVNPLREAPYDDDWAFGETVKHLLETGQYRLNDWLGPNMPFQAVWGALFCLPGGYSFAALRLSTIVLAVIGLVAFRAGWPSRHGISRGAANLLTLCLASSPLFFKLSLTFLSDVPFVAVTLVATLFYTRALRDERWSSWLAASLAASAAIFIRQFGMALVGGLALIWLADARRWQRLPRYLLGVLLPGAAALWQLNQGWNHSTWAQALLLSRQRAFFGGADFLRTCRGGHSC